MLVLTRKASEMINLGDDIEVRVLSIDGNRVKIGVVAPDKVRVMRGELLEEKQDAN